MTVRETAIIVCSVLCLSPLSTSAATLTIPFVENWGQAGRDVAFSARALGGGVSITRSGELVLALPKTCDAAQSPLVVREIPRRARTPRVSGAHRAALRLSYYVGKDPGRWRSGLPTYDSLALDEVWQGIDIVVAMRGSGVEKIFTLAPGADPARIQIGIEGVDSLHVRDDGTLAATACGAELRFTAPRAWQVRSGVRQPVEISYRLAAHGYGFALGPYDRELALVIDPLIATTYLGGCASDDVRDIAVNQLAGDPNAGDVYVAGATTSSDFGSPCAPIQTDAFVARFDRRLAALRDIVFLGSPDGSDGPISIAIAPDGHPLAGSIVVLGETDDAADFPGTGFGPGGRDDLFLAILAPDLTLQTAGHLGGALNDRNGMLAIHPDSGEIYVAGETNSTDFPGVAGGAQAAHGGIYDAFVARFGITFTEPAAPSLVLEQSTYLGGATGSEVNASVAFAGSTGVYVKGRTNAKDLPVTPGAPQSVHGGGIEDLFVALVTADLRSFQAVTYLGGNGIEETGHSHIVVQASTGKPHLVGTTRSEDQNAGVQWSRGGFLARFSPTLDHIEQVVIEPMSEVYDLLEHPSGELYLLGTAASDSFAGDRTADAAQASYGGGLSDGCIARYDADLHPLRVTYLGGGDRESSLRFGVHPMSGDIYVAGNTRSTDLPFSGDAAQSTLAGGLDGFVARLNPQLAAAGVHQSSYLGGTGDDLVQALHLPDLDDVYVGGFTTSDDLPGTTGAPQAMPGGGDTDGFVAVFARDLSAATPPCVGDCDSDGEVRINELITAVNIALGDRPLEDCRSVDSDGDGSVLVNELIQAVNNALGGCTSDASGETSLGA